MKLSHLFTVIAFGVGAISVQAGDTTNAPISTVPEGIATFNLPATGVGVSATSYFSAPLVNDPMYTGAVSAASANMVTVDDTPAPWNAGEFGAPANPYFLKFLSGLQSGRVLQVLANGTNTLTLDTGDNTFQTVALNAPAFAVAAGDTFEVFAGDTLGLMFGLNTAQSPLVLKGGSIINADSVSVFAPKLNQLISFYFNTSLGYWVQVGAVGNANNTIIRPYTAFLITRRSNEPANSFVLTGRVAEVNHVVKITGGGAVAYDSTGYPVDIKLSELKLGSNWAKAAIPALPAQPSAIFADSISVWNTFANHFDSYFELTDNTWRKLGGDSTDQSSFVIPSATTVCFVKRSSVNGSTSYIAPVLPYSLTN